MKALITALFTTVALPAMAADMPIKAPPQAVIQAVGNWSGFYIFGFGGYSSGKISPDDFNVADVSGFGVQKGDFHNPKPKGGVFGFGGGYLWQMPGSGWVGGVEVDYGFSSEKDNQSVSTTKVLGCDGKCTGTTSLDSKIDALASARLRVGYTIMPNLLLYGTGGIGWGRAETSFTLSCTGGCGPNLAFVAKPNLFGWVAGAGAEFKVVQNMRIRAEYLHYDFGSTGYAFQPLVTINAKTTDDVVRGALIWSFH